MSQDIHVVDHRNGMDIHVVDHRGETCNEDPFLLMEKHVAGLASKVEEWDGPKEYIGGSRSKRLCLYKVLLFSPSEPLAQVERRILDAVDNLRAVIHMCANGRCVEYIGNAPVFLNCEDGRFLFHTIHEFTECRELRIRSYVNFQESHGIIEREQDKK